MLTTIDSQKVMIKGALLKDDEWAKATPKDGAMIMLMGSAEAKLVEPPKEAHIFVEDLPEDQQVWEGSRAGTGGELGLA
jgi:ubiquitin carboxyl-terminal hydrolase 14